jgi:hypothetical protein
LLASESISCIAKLQRHKSQSNKSVHQRLSYPKAFAHSLNQELTPRNLFIDSLRNPKNDISISIQHVGRR